MPVEGARASDGLKRNSNFGYASAQVFLLNAGPDTKLVLRRSDAVANQSRVLEAAEQVFAEQGISAEIKDIADRAGVGVATIYRGFGSKEGLVQATIECADDAIAELLAEAEGAGDALVALRLLVTGMLHYAESYGWLIQALLSGVDLRRSEASLQRRDRHRQRSMQVIRSAIEAGVIHSGLSEQVVKHLLDGSVVLLTFRKMRREPHPPVEAIAEAFVLMLTGSAAAEVAP